MINLYYRIKFDLGEKWKAFKSWLFMKKCYWYVRKGWLTKHETEDLVGFKYSLATTYAGHWDKVTMQCRGIVFEKKTGKIVAHPFDKFFNYSEIFAEDGTYAETGKIISRFKEFEPSIAGSFLATNKIDGSLIICFKYKDEWILKTAGSFYSEQAIWAKKWFDEHVDASKLIGGETYCFESTSKDDVHVVHYDYEGLTLLSAFYATHLEYPRADLEKLAKEIGVPVTEVITGYQNLKDCVDQAKKLDLNYEGYVLAFNSAHTINGYPVKFRLKVKGDEYIEMFKRINCITYKSIRDHFDCMSGVVDIDYVKFIPEELVGMRNYVGIVERYYAEALEKVKGIVTRISGIEDARTRYETAVAVATEYKCKQYVGIAINAIKFGSIDRVRPDLWMKTNRELKKLYKGDVHGKCKNQQSSL